MIFNLFVYKLITEQHENEFIEIFSEILAYLKYCRLIVYIYVTNVPNARL